MPCALGSSAPALRAHPAHQALGGGGGAGPADQQAQGGRLRQGAHAEGLPAGGVQGVGDGQARQVGAQTGPVGGGVADPAAEGRGREVAAGGVGRHLDGRQQRHPVAVGAAQPRPVERVQRGDHGDGDGRGGAQAELAARGVVQLGGDVQVEVAGRQAPLGPQALHHGDGAEHVVVGLVLDDDADGAAVGVLALGAGPQHGRLAVLGGVHLADVVAGHQAHGEVAVHRHQDGGLAGLDHRVLPGDEQLAGGAGLDHAGTPASGAGSTGSSTSAAPGPAPTTRTWPRPSTRAATAAASSGRQTSTTFGPASAVA